MAPESLHKHRVLIVGDRSALTMVRIVDGDSATGETVQDEQQEEAEVQSPPSPDESNSQEAGEGNSTVALQTV